MACLRLLREGGQLTGKKHDLLTLYVIPSASSLKGHLLANQDESRARPSNGFG